jgi:hypothetical protein
MYFRLINCAQTADIDLKVKMYSYKQLAICFMKLKEHKTAQRALNKML